MGERTQIPRSQEGVVVRAGGLDCPVHTGTSGAGGGSEGQCGRGPGWSPSAEGQHMSPEAPVRGLGGRGQYSALSGPGPGAFASAESDSEFAARLHPSDPKEGGGWERREPGHSLPPPDPVSSSPSLPAPCSSSLHQPPIVQIGKLRPREQQWRPQNQ